MKSVSARHHCSSRRCAGGTSSSGVAAPAEGGRRRRREAAAAQLLRLAVVVAGVICSCRCAADDPPSPPATTTPTEEEPGVTTVIEQPSFSPGDGPLKRSNNESSLLYGPRRRPSASGSDDAGRQQQQEVVTAFAAPAAPSASWADFLLGPLRPLVRNIAGVQRGATFGSGGVASSSSSSSASSSASSQPAEEDESRWFVHLDRGNPDDPVPPPSIADPAAFVRVQGTAFALGCREFAMTGFNSYTLMEMAAGTPWGSWDSDWSIDGKEQVRALLDAAQAAGMRFVRTWAFSVNPTYPLQVGPNVYDERLLRGFDFLIAEAGKRRIRIIFALVDYWQDVGGIREYVSWSRGPGRGAREDFFGDRRCKELYKRHVRNMLLRRNTITGQVYREDPSILAWELINEPRCRGCASAMKGWIREMARFVKRLDPTHLLSVGEEGFYTSTASSPNANANPAVWAWSTGQDFIDDHSHPEIDFAAVHIWPENWGILSTTGLAPIPYTQQWLTAHIQDAHNILRKPLLVEEFGRSPQIDATGAGREQFFDAVHGTIEAARAQGYGVYGTAFWHMYSDATSGGDRSRVTDQYAIFPADTAIMRKVRRHSAALRNMSKAVPAPAVAAAGGEGGWLGGEFVACGGAG